MSNLNPKQSLKPIKGSRAPGIGYLYVAVMLFIAIMAGTVLSGGFIPLDPNGPGGPPTLAPYWDANGVDAQRIIFPSGTVDPRNNLQLKTFKVDVCGSTSVFNFLIDVSGSMQYDNKIGKLKSGLQAFAKQLSPSAVVGMQTFAANVQNRVPIDYYKNNKQQFIANIDGLNPVGWTRLRDGFQLAKAELTNAITRNKFPGYKYYLILLSDGVPETPGGPNDPPRTCMTPPGPVYEPLLAPDNIRCFTVQQDPRVPTNIATDLKNIGVEIYSIGILGASQPQSDGPMRPYLEALLRDVASTPTDTHYFATNNQAVNLETILKGLVSTICRETIGGQEQTTPSPINYPFPTYPDNATHVPYTPPGGAFN